MDPLTLDILISIARWLLTVLGTALVSHHVITADQNDAVLKAVFQHLAIWIPLAASFALMLWARIRNRRKFMAALSMPLGSTENDVKAKVASGVPIPALTTPPNTIPGIPKVNV